MDIKDIKLGGHVVELRNNGELLWEGQSQRPNNNPFQLISSPSVLTVEGQRSSIMQADPVEYFEKSGSVYLLKGTPANASPSIYMDFVIESVGDEQVQVDFHLILSVMTGRKKLASATLDVGEPILAKKEIPVKLRTQINQWFVPALYVSKGDSTGNKEYMIVLMQILRVK